MQSRLSLVRFFIYFGGFIIVSRLFYWQVIQSKSLSAEAVDQRTSTETLSASRGSIYASDGYVLATNKDYYLLYSYKPQVEDDYREVSRRLAPIIINDPIDATEAAVPIDQRIQTLENELFSKLSDPEKKWVPLKRGLTDEVREKVENLEITGLGFDTYQRRYYPEASMSAHLLGFVGHDDSGKEKGYFGVEGQYDLELQGKPGRVVQEKDATGKPIVIGFFDQFKSRQGRDLYLHLDRSIQHLVESRLSEGLEKYGAVSGEVIVMDPYTGGIVASAAFPSYDPANIGDFSPELYKNPVVANAYEPGSTFKVLVMAAGINSGLVTPDTVCGRLCNSPVQIGEYSIRTWNHEYDDTQTMTDVLANSDNTGMVFVARKLEKEKFVESIRSFGFGELTGVDLQEESSPKLREKWGEIDVATTSFGQGIAVTGIQMAQAVSAIANGGDLMKPQVVDAVVDSGRRIDIAPQIMSKVISSETAAAVTEMMRASAHHGESQWAVLRDYQVAGKTGTAQIPIDGHYDEEKTIASFVGFAPANDPKFVMLVKLREPQSSQWASETAAPLWYRLAQELLWHYNVPPEK